MQATVSFVLNEQPPKQETWRRRERPRGTRELVRWFKDFTSDIKDDSVLELALGYTYALILLDIPNSKVEFLYLNKTYNKERFIRSEPMIRHVVRGKTNPPDIDISPLVYLRRNRILANRKDIMNYAMIVSLTNEDDGPVSIIQFNHLEFLQGFLSVLNGFGVGTIRYIYMILDREGTIYTLK